MNKASGHGRRTACRLARRSQ